MHIVIVGRSRVELNCTIQHLGNWMAKQEASALDDSWVWSECSAHSDHQDEQWLHPEKSPGGRATFAVGTKQRAGMQVDRAIAQWLGRSIRRWASVRNAMERLYVENKMQTTPVGWCEHHARVFCGASSQTGSNGDVVEHLQLDEMNQ